MKMKFFYLLFFFGTLPIFAQVTVTGVVTDEHNEPLPGANVLVKGTTRGVATDFDGNYSIEARSGDVLVFSSIGFVTQEVTVSDKTQTLNVLLKEDLQELSEVVVVAFGTQKKENLTGAVSSVSAKVLDSRPVNNAAQALQGATTGINFSVGNSGGEIDNTLSFNVRGAGTLDGNTTVSSPLVLIDGMEGNISSLNPQDIESISVLKDAASSSIYGSRAAFGVILIKTKTGKEGRVTVSYNQSYRLSSALLQPNTVDSETFAYYFNEASANAGRTAIFRNDILEKIIQYKNGEISEATSWVPNQNQWGGFNISWANVNWFKQFYRNNAPSQDHNLSVSGGTEKLNFFFSANWLNQEGLLRYNSDELNRYSVLGRFSAKINDKVRLLYKANFIRTDHDRPLWQSGLFYHNIARRWPTVPVYDPNGNYTAQSQIPQLEGADQNTQTDEMIQQLSLVITPLKNWKIHIEGNFKNRTQFQHQQVLPIYYYDPNGNPIAYSYNGLGYTQPGQTRITEYANKQNYYNPNIYSNYDFSLNKKHNFKVMAGFQAELNKYRAFKAYRDDLYTTSITALNATYGENDAVEGEFQHWATAGFFGRLNYDYNGKYLLEFNLRYDGTSRYLRNQRWNTFPSVSIGWNITRETFWEKIPWLKENVNIFKPRFSYGKLGNQNTRNWYPFYQKMPLKVNDGKWLINGQMTNTAKAPDLISALLSWENVSSLNYGIDINMFNSRLNIVFDYFVRKTEGMVGPAPLLPATLGTSPAQFNNTDMESRGFELEVGWNDVLKNGFSYGARFTLTDNRQFVTNYPNDAKLLDSKYYTGSEIGEIWGYTTVGIAKTDAEMTQHLTNNLPTWGTRWAAGDVMYADLNGDGRVDQGANTADNPGDRRIIGNSTPRYNFGLDLSASWKGVDFRMFFQGTMKRDFSFGETPYFVGANVNMWQASAYVENMDYFRPEGTQSPFGANVDAYFPRPIIGGEGLKNYKDQTRFLQNAAYIRLKNIQLGYTIPTEITKQLGITKCRFYISAENVWTYTKMIKIFDPETVGGAWGAGKLYPLSKIWSTGINLTF